MVTPMKYPLLAGLCLLASFAAADFSETRQQAETFYDQHSYAKALELYESIDPSALSARQQRWLKFRLADTSWRAAAGSDSRDSSVLEAARSELESLVSAGKERAARDSIWAEAQESLGDFHWTRRNSRNWPAAWPHYQAALNYWAASTDLETAKRQYLDIVEQTLAPEGERNYSNYPRPQLPLSYLQDALSLTTEKTAKARLHYAIAITLTQQSHNHQQARISEAFEGALQAGKGSEWYDDALFQYAQWIQHQENDFTRAVELYRRFLKEFKKGETRYYDQAESYLAELTGTHIDLSVSNQFSPNTAPHFYLSWRNTAAVRFALYRIDLQTQDLEGIHPNNESWFDLVELDDPLRSWNEPVEVDAPYAPGRKEVGLEKLPAGAYLLEAKANRQTARALLLVTNTVLITKTSSTQLLAYLTEAENGRPIAKGALSLWLKSHRDHDRSEWKKQTATTNQDGLAVFSLPEESRQQGYLLLSSSDNRPAVTSSYLNYHPSRDDWKIYAFTDRSAYRPGDTAKWKILVKRSQEGAYEIPAGRSLNYEIFDGRGNKVTEARITLNRFGSAWGELALPEDAALGMWRIQFRATDKSHIGGANLLRLEEYKLPEYKVRVETPEEEVYLLGDTVKATITAEYYFGGPVSDADVEVLIHQNHFHHVWWPDRPYPWLYSNRQSNRHYGGGQIIKREQLKTGADGTVTVEFETPANAGSDFQYRIEARVVDASRREIVGETTVRVTRHPYYAHLDPRHRISQPGDEVNVDLKTIDANNQPVSAKGEVTLVRSQWVEIWYASDGREVTGQELEQIRASSPIFPPAPKPDRAPWRLKSRGYEKESIKSEPINTNEEGEAVITFIPERAGYYQISWTSKEHPDIRTETGLFIANDAETNIGYHPGGLEIVADRDTFRTGQSAPIMLSTPTNDRWVLFTTEADDLYSYQVVHIPGTVKLLQVPLTERETPNVYLTATMTSGRLVYQDFEEVVVPPDASFIDVTVEGLPDQVQPGGSGKVKVKTHDRDGNPVAAEVALSVSDEALSYIQSDLAGDPREFFFGQQRHRRVRSDNSLSGVPFAKPDAERLKNKRDLKRENRASSSSSGFLDTAETSRQFSVGQSGPTSSLARAGAGAAFGARNEQVESDMMLTANVAAPMPMEEAAVDEPAVTVRSDFSATAFWQPAILTDDAGEALAEVTYPDSTTTWIARAWAATSNGKVGDGRASIVARQPLIVRLQAPRFFVAGDQSTISAVINNNSETAQDVRPEIAVEGLELLDPAKPESVTVKAQGEVRVDWNVRAVTPGKAVITTTARGNDHADAMKRDYEVFEHGIDRLLVQAGKVSDEQVDIAMHLPEARRAGSEKLTIQITPSLAVTMLDALPYLADYPYGCTEQTMSRFLPAAIVRKTLNDAGLDGETVMNRTFGGITDDTRAKRNPADLSELDAMIRKGLERLYDFQHGDGGWGWWKTGDSDHYMTAYVVWGLALAKEAGINIDSSALQQGRRYLQQEIVEAELRPDLQAWMLHGLTAGGNQGGKTARVAFENLWESRDQLSSYSRALLALSAHAMNQRDKAGILIENLSNGVVIDRTPDASILIGNQSAPAVIPTAHWGEQRGWYRWSEGAVESTAFVLRALMKIDPENSLVEPTMNWLVKNRRGAQWNNTRDTAICVLALNDYLQAGDELESAAHFSLEVNGQLIAEKELTSEAMFHAPSRFDIDRDHLKSGENIIRIRQLGESRPLYFSAEASFFSLEEPIPASGNELFVKRQYFKLVPTPTLLNGLEYERQPLRDGEKVESGERVEVLLTMETKNDYEYLLIEDLKPAGLESVEIQSGGNHRARELRDDAEIGQDPDAARYTNRTEPAYQELRDRKVAFFLSELPQGKWEMRYDLRAEVPGIYHALPVMGEAMYVPEIKANGAEIMITVQD